MDGVRKPSNLHGINGLACHSRPLCSLSQLDALQTCQSLGPEYLKANRYTSRSTDCFN